MKTNAIKLTNNGLIKYHLMLEINGINFHVVLRIESDIDEYLFFGLIIAYKPKHSCWRYPSSNVDVDITLTSLGHQLDSRMKKLTRTGEPKGFHLSCTETIDGKLDYVGQNETK